MNKREISESIYKKLNIKRFEAYSFVDLMIEVIVENLSKNKKVMVSNFGTFKVVERQPKRVINPNSKEAMIIPGRKIVKFFPSKTLKESVGNSHGR
ncbi:MAG: HU family DNA-binding protein [Candidatus Aminicenantes bacterium]|nr:HU family DNA-binding protein [Candidatus Aminicenantes bacterium]